MNNVVKRIQEDYLSMSDTFKLIANTVLKYQNNFDLTVKQLSEESYCAQSTVIKFCNSLGFDSYKVFKHEVNMQDNNDYTSIIKSFELVESYIDGNSDMVSDLIVNITQAKQIYVFATGQSKIPAIDFYLKINKKLSDKAIFEYEPSIQKRIIKTISTNDLVILISNSGLSKELISFVPLIEAQCQNIFLVSNREKSTLSHLIPKRIILNNNLESAHNFKEFPRESKYSLLYFFDQIFEMIR